MVSSLETDGVGPRRQPPRGCANVHTRQQRHRRGHIHQPLGQLGDALPARVDQLLVQRLPQRLAQRLCRPCRPRETFGAARVQELVAHVRCISADGDTLHCRDLPQRGPSGPHPRVACMEPVNIATISNLEDHTTEDASTGAVRSIQAADLSLPQAALGKLWSPMYLERLARTYWRFLTRVTLGLVRVRYSQTERSLVLLVPALKLIVFAPPEYELEPGHGIVRWRIRSGLLVARPGRDGGGYLQIEVRLVPTRRRPHASPASRRPHTSPARAPRARACTSRSRWPASIRRSPPASDAASTARPNRASTCSSRTASCARSPAWTWRLRASAASRVSSYPRSAASFARSCVALMRRIVPERVRITSDSVVAPPALG